MRHWWWKTRQREDELDEEIAHDLRLETEARRRAGVADAEAEEASRQDFGDIDRIKAAARTAWTPSERVMFRESVARDLRHTTRFLRSHRGYVVLTSGVLALAVGMNLLVFSIVNALWLRPLSIVDPARLVTVLQPRDRVIIPSLDWPALKVFDGPVAGQVVTTGLYEAFKPRIALPQIAGPVETLGVTPLYFAVLGVPIRGRAFTDADDRAGAEAVAILSDRMWTRAFGRDPDVIGSRVDATPKPLRIVGIAPPGFDGARRGEQADLWVPIQVVRDLAPADRQIDAPGLMVFARVSTGQTIAALERQYRDRLPPAPDGTALPAGLAPTFAPLTEVFGTADSPSILIRGRGTLEVVAGLSLLVLLGGCATIAALVLTHYERRRPELAVKSSLGASTARLARELLLELLVVGVLGTAGSVIVGAFGARLIPALSLPGGVNVGRLDLSVDWRLCAVALIATFITLVVAGALPLWNVSHRRLAGEVSTGPSTTSVDAWRLRRRLLALQVAATTVVLIASGLFVRTVLYSFRVGAGFDVDRTVFVSVEEKSLAGADGLPPPGTNLRAIGLAHRAQLTDLFAQLPSVHTIAGGTAPLGGDVINTHAPRALTISVDAHDETLLVGMLSGTPNLLSTLGVPLLAGRALTSADGAGGQRANPVPVVITRSLAQRLSADGNPTGQVFVSRPNFPRSFLVVGVAENFAFGTLLRPVDGVLVTAGGDLDYNLATNLVLRADDPAAVAAAVPKLLPDRVVRVATGREIIGRDIAQQRLGAWVFSGFGVVALLLGVCGVFGLVSYLAQTRRREFGLRMALGATLSDVVRGAVTSALRPVAAGVVAGLLIGAIVSRVFAALLVGVGGLDPGTYASVGLVMLIPATLAALAAASRLRRLTPSDALRQG